MPAPTVYARVLGWLRAGYPEGIPPTDYVSVLSVLRRHLPESSIEEIADQLAAQAAAGVDPVTPEQIRSMIRDQSLQSAGDDDVRRVSARLAGAGWPLSGDLD